MQRQEMSMKCKRLLDRFDRLEALLAHIAVQNHECVFRGAQEIKELYQVARYETIARATSEQVTHLQTLDEVSRQLLKGIPRKVRGELKDD